MNLDFVQGESTLEKRRKFVSVLRSFVDVLESSDTHNESAARLIDLAGGYDQVISFLKGVDRVTAVTVRELAVLTRIEAHERGLIDANTKEG